MRPHALRELAREEKTVIEALMAEYEDTHRTFEHLIWDLEQLEDLTERLERESDGTARMRLIKQHGGNRLLADLNATLNRLLRDEETLLRSTKQTRHSVAADIIETIKRFEHAR